jgi:hypothetical protein
MRDEGLGECEVVKLKHFAFPRPLPPPVMSAFLPFKFIILYL